MRDDDVKTILAHVKKSLVHIKNTYDQSLQDKNIPDYLRVDVKSVMEHLRSTLDYMAIDIAVAIKKKRAHFPYGKNEQAFNNSIKSNLPSLKTVRPNIYSLIEDIQPHACGSTWLYDLCHIVNSNKHDCLSPQRRTSQTTYNVGLTGKGSMISAPAGAIEAPPGAISIGNAPIIFDQKTGIPLQTPGLEVEVTTWVSFAFQDTSVKVYPLMMTALREIEKMSNKLYKIIL